MLHVGDMEIESNVLTVFKQILESNKIYYTDEILKYELTCSGVGQYQQA
jgi:hypothetical protein